MTTTEYKVKKVSTTGPSSYASVQSTGLSGVPVSSSPASVSGGVQAWLSSPERARYEGKWVALERDTGKFIADGLKLRDLPVEARRSPRYVTMFVRPRSGRRIV